MAILYYLIILLLFLVMLLSILFLVSALFSSIPFVPVREKILNEIISALEFDKKSILYDLGCGDGRVLFSAIKIHPGISCVGVEIAPFPFLLAKIKSFFNPSKNVHILYGNFFNLDISPASHVFLYLFPEALDKLLPKFEKELKPGTKVVSCDFEFSNKKSEKVIELKSAQSQKNKRLYVYNF